MTKRLGLVAGSLMLLLGCRAQADGYKDTPLVPGTEWHVHDPDRPQPPVVDAGPGPVDPLPVPEGVTVLFDGTNLDQWTTDGQDATWKVENGYAECVPKKGWIETRQKFGDCTLHIEWCVPEGNEGHGQSRGNSGVHFVGHTFEIQVLDSYQNETYADGMAAALYGQYPPTANPCRPQGQWNVYDITFTVAKYDADGKLTEPATATVIFNGVTVQDHIPFLGPTGHKRLPKYPDKPLPSMGPIAMQNHSNNVRIRNVWLREGAGE